MEKNIIKFIEIYNKEQLGEYKENVNLKNYNTYKVDALGRLIIFPKDTKSLIRALQIIKEKKINYLVLGNGSNVIFNFDVFKGIIIKLDKLDKLKINSNLVTVGAGYMVPKLAYLVAKQGLSGLEFAYGIPGMVGASIAMNAGAYNASFADIVKDVLVLTPSLEVKTLNNKDLNFAYRDSFLKQNKDYIVLEANLVLTKKDKEQILSLMQERKEKRLATQPLDKPSAGSVFRNPLNLYAGSLIENCNLKGYNINGAKVSLKHANFIINDGLAKGKDIVNLINLIKDKVEEKYNVDLILEQIIINGDISE